MGKETNKYLKAGWFDLMPIKIEVPKDTETGAKTLFVMVDSTEKIRDL